MITLNIKKIWKIFGIINKGERLWRCRNEKVDYCVVCGGTDAFGIRSAKNE
jgi:hypothetical protein